MTSFPPVRIALGVSRSNAKFKLSLPDTGELHNRQYSEPPLRKAYRAGLLRQYAEDIEMTRDCSSSPPQTQLDNTTLRLILGRRSFRGPFSDRALSDDSIAQIVRCGLASPSSKNAQPWRLHVVTNRTLLQSLADEIVSAEGAGDYVPTDPETGSARQDWSSTVVESADALRAAPLTIFIENTGTFSKGRATLVAAPPSFLEANLITYSLEVLGIGAAVMNMWLGALSLGAQAVFMGDVCVAETAILKAIGGSHDLIGALSIGYPATAPLPKTPDMTLTDDPRVSWLHKT